MPAYMQTYLEKLQAHAAAMNIKNQIWLETPTITTKDKLHTIKPLNEQIAELMISLPPQILNRPWSMAELVLRLNGKYRDRPHAQHVGNALRKLGWKRDRYWSKGYDGVRVWIPPQ